MTMNDIFGQLQPPEPHLPDGFEKEVFASLETMQLIADVIDLFTSQFIQSEAELTGMLGGSFHDKEEDKNEAEEENNE